MLPIIIILIVFSLVLSFLGSVSSSISNVANGGEIIYNNRQMEDYAKVEYAKEFENAVEYEDNILIVFLVDEDREGYYTIAYIGDYINDDIAAMFGNEYTEYGQIMTSTINSYYENSISRNLASVVDKMGDKIVNLSSDSSFKYPTNSPGEYKSHLTNKSDLEINTKTVNESLEAFTEDTGIPIVIVVDNIDNVFDKTVNRVDITTVMLAAVLVGLAVFFIFRSIKGRGENTNFSDDEERRNNSTRW